MKRYDTIIFDLDGTLLDTLEDLKNSVNVAMKEFGYPPRTLDEVRSFVGNGAGELIRLALPGGFENPNFDEVLAFFRADYAKNCNILTAPYNGVCEAMSALKADGRKLAIVSNKPDAAVKTLSELYFSGLADIAAGEDEAHGIRRKPWPDSVESALRQLGADKSSAVYVGDSEVDIATSRNAGLPCISVTWGFRTRAQLEAAGAEVYADTPEELTEYLMKR